MERARKAFEDAQRCRRLGQENCSVEAWESYVKLAQGIGINDFNCPAPTLTPLRHISTGGVLRDNNMSGPAWVQIDHGKIWDLQKEPSLARDENEAVMSSEVVRLVESSENDDNELIDSDNLRHV